MNRRGDDWWKVWLIIFLFAPLILFIGLILINFILRLLVGYTDFLVQFLGLEPKSTLLSIAFFGFPLLILMLLSALVNKLTKSKTSLPK